jgi:hypothetical protein
MEQKSLFCADGGVRFLAGVAVGDGAGDGGDGGAVGLDRQAEGVVELGAAGGLSGVVDDDAGGALGVGDLVVDGGGAAASGLDLADAGDVEDVEGAGGASAAFIEVADIDGGAVG